MKRLFFAVVTIIFAVSCTKEIDMDYRSVEKLYVIEGFTTNVGSCVSITRTSDMDKSMDQSRCEATSVTLKCSDGDYDLILNDEGFYTSVWRAATYIGESFTLDVEIDGKHYTSTSEVMAPPRIVTMDIFNAEVIGKNAYFCNVVATKSDASEGDTYYRYELFVEDEKILWGVYMHDKNNANPIVLSLMFASNMSGKIEAANKAKTPVAQGDMVMVNLESIDKRTYEYLNTLSLSSQSSSNPVDNFSGGALGYYTAYFMNSSQIPFE